MSKLILCTIPLKPSSPSFGANVVIPGIHYKVSPLLEGQQILTDLTYKPTDIDDLMAATGVPAHALQKTAILALEITGEVQRLPGGRMMWMTD